MSAASKQYLELVLQDIAKRTDDVIDVEPISLAPKSEPPMTNKENMK